MRGGSVAARAREERALLNVVRVRAVTGLMTVLHLVIGTSFWLFPPPDAEAERAFRLGLSTIHLVTLPFAALLFVLGVLPRPKRPRLYEEWASEVFVGGYLAVGVALTLNAQRLFASNVNGFVLATVVPALIVQPRFRVALALHVALDVAFVLGLRVVQPNHSAFVSATVAALSTSLVALVMLRAMATQARLTLEARLELEAERAALVEANAALDTASQALATQNDELERRVDAQVQEIVHRSEEIAGLNAQLMEKVRERSRELTGALARIASLAPVDVGVLRAGTVLGGRVRVLALLGRGGMGSVYRAEDLVTGVQVAVKVVLGSQLAGLDSLHRFLLEARAAASVSHPSIARTLHLDVSEEGHFFQVQELIQGSSLHAILAANGRLEAGEACRLGAELADALAAAHDAGLVHRDVKPSNVMMTAEGTGIKLIDFGLSKLRERDADHIETREGIIVGTPGYMAPEQVTGHEEIDGRADVYGAALVVYRAAAGSGPFDAKRPSALLAAQLLATPRPLGDVLADAPPALMPLLGRALAKKAAARPTAHELARELGELANALGAPPLPEIARRRLVLEVDSLLSPTRLEGLVKAKLG